MTQKIPTPIHRFNYFAYPEIIKIIKPKYVISIAKEELLIIVCNFLDQDIDFIKTRNRKQETVQARQIYYYFANKYCRNTLTEIGKELGYDHATVLHGKKQIENLISFDKKLASIISEIDIFLKTMITKNK